MIAWAVARREFASFFRVPLGWAVLAVFAMISGWLFLRGVLVPGQPATMRPIFATMGWLLLPLAPAISMRLIAEELRSGTIEPLMTSPASDYAVIAGKFLGALLFLGVLTAPTLVHVAVLWTHASPAPDAGPLLAGYLSFGLLAALLLSAGLLISTLTSNQTLAFLGALLAALAMLVGPELAASSLVGWDSPRAPGVIAFIRGLEVGRRLEDFAKGVVSTGHIAAFAAWTAAFLAAAAVSLESRRWRSARPILRGLKFGLLSMVMLAAVLVSAVLGTALADRHDRRFDVTSTGEHRLAPRSAALALQLKGRAEIVVAADWLTLDRRARESLGDVLDRFERDGVPARRIDFSAQSGRAAYAELLRDMAAREAPDLARDRGIVETAVKQAGAIRADVTTNIPQGVADVISTVPDGGDALRAIAARARQGAERAADAARGLAAAEDQATTLLSRQIEGIPLPAVDAAGLALRSALDGAARQLLALESELRTLASAQPRAAAALRAGADGVRSRREAADAAAEPLRGLAPLDVLTVAAAASESAVVVVRSTTPRPAGARAGVGVRAVPLQRITGETSAADLRRRAEAEIAAGLAAIANPNPPIVVLLSSDPAIASGVNPYEEAMRRLRLSGADVLVWDLIMSPDPPSTAALNPTGARSVIYIVRMPDQSQPAFGQVPSGIDRARQLADAAKELSSKGAPVLMGVAPAVVPTSKEAEAADRVLSAFGASAKSDRPILTEIRSPAGIAADFNARARALGDSPLARAASRDAVVLPWATPLTSGASSTPALTVEGANVWREARWLELRRPGPDGRPARMPAYDAAEDERGGPWTVVLSADLPASGIAPARRLVAVGSAEWLDDALLSRRISVDGRIAPVAAGNLELLDAAVAWLSGQESLALPSASAGAVAAVAPITDSARRRLWWMLVAGLPAGIAGLGVLNRLRG